jgi:glycosyltransferase involved in cell wall biosynthesis
LENRLSRTGKLKEDKDMGKTALASPIYGPLAQESAEKKIAVVLPAYNEELTIAEVIAAFHEALPQAELVVINNGSTDATGRIASETLSRLHGQGRVINEWRQGKGNAVRRAFRDVDADIYLLADADLTYPAEQAGELIQPVLDDEADMVVGDRLSGGNYQRENKRPFHDAGNLLVKRLVNGLFKARLADIMSGYRAFNRKFVKSYPILIEGFQLETDMTLHALDKRFRILEIPVDYKDRPPGSCSKLNTVADGARVLLTIIRILRHYRPLIFFGGLTILLGLLGLVAAIPVFQDWLQYHYIYHVPLAILAAALEIVAIIALNVGLVLDSINHQHRMNFERELL